MWPSQIQEVTSDDNSFSGHSHFLKNNLIKNVKFRDRPFKCLYT